MINNLKLSNSSKYTDIRFIDLGAPKITNVNLKLNYLVELYWNLLNVNDFFGYNVIILCTDNIYLRKSFASLKNVFYYNDIITIYSDLWKSEFSKFHRGRWKYSEWQNRLCGFIESYYDNPIRRHVCDLPVSPLDRILSGPFRARERRRKKKKKNRDDFTLENSR